VNQILQLPIARHGGEDIAIWPFTKHSNYIVCLAYYFACSNKFFKPKGQREGKHIRCEGIGENLEGYMAHQGIGQDDHSPMAVCS
jgi:hypothetical protein